jgi:L-seryl-tRNA(Ser) seleniumtransferase
VIEMTKKVIRLKRDIPAVEIIASDDNIVSAAESLPRPLIIEIIQDEIKKVKDELGVKYDTLDYRQFISNLIQSINKMTLKQIGQVINGTGILVHTNLGRAPLSETLFDKIKENVTGYGNLEFDIFSGKRGKRGILAEKHLALISTAEAATIVNNNAAALFIILNSLAARRKVLISRGELVQIGGGFRIPDIIRKSGARLIEVGTTNITSLEDYKSAFEQNPAMILKVHKSNFVVGGFTDEVDLKSLVKLGQKASVPVVNDLGSGILIDSAKTIGIKEPSVRSSVYCGADLTCFSGDKLLGGVQSGLIVGSGEMIAKIKKNPIYRALRVDKIIFSAIEQLLGYYLNDSWRENIKLWRLATISESDLYEKGQALLKQLKAGDKISLAASKAEMGGGSLPEKSLPSVALIFNSSLPAQKIATLFRLMKPPVIGRIADDRFLIDLKAIDPENYKILVTAIKAALKQI